MKGIPSYALKDVIAALEKAMASSDASMFFKPDGAPYYGASPSADDKIALKLIEVRLEDIDTYSTNGSVDCYILRFSYANPHAADPGKRDFKTDKRAVFQISPGEAGDFGAHMLIAPPDKGGVHAGLSKCVLEQMTGLSRSKIISLIQQVANQYMEESARPTYEYDEKVRGKKQRKRDTTTLKVRDYPEKSETLQEDIDKGALKEIRFVSKEASTDDLPQGLERPVEVLTVKVSENYRKGKNARNLIHDVAEYARARSLKAKLGIEKEERGRSSTALRELVLDKSGLLDQLFVRQATISPGVDMPMCYDATHGGICQALKSILDDKRLWM